jgi:hypothetical protein
MLVFFLQNFYAATQNILLVCLRACFRQSPRGERLCGDVCHIVLTEILRASELSLPPRGLSDMDSRNLN